jgi:hypothetical protein
MTATISFKSKSGLTYAKNLAVFMLAACILSLAGCGGTTKVYNTQKTIVYKGDLYNASNVQKISTRVEGQTPDGNVINMKGMDKKAAQAVLDDNPRLMVSSVIEMDQTEMVYQRSQITKSSEFTSMMKNLDRATSSISKFMANKKSTQLKLK